MEQISRPSIRDYSADNSVVEEACTTNGCNGFTPHHEKTESIVCPARHNLMDNSASTEKDMTWEFVNQSNEPGPSSTQLGGLGRASSKVQQINGMSKPEGLPIFDGGESLGARTNDIGIRASRQRAETGRLSSASTSTSKSLEKVKVEKNDQSDNSDFSSEHSDFEADVHQSTSLEPPMKTLKKLNNKRARGNGSYIPRSSIPQSTPQKEFARQCLLAAYSSRLNPYALHSDELKLLQGRITYPQVTIYLNIRNAILRLWTRNPLLSVSLEEALGCAKDSRHFGLAQLAYYWLLRNGYVNFGCVETAKIDTLTMRLKSKTSKQRIVVVIGAGMAGLGCARHLNGLFSSFADNFTERDEMPPRIIVLEGRSRIGGRIYSHPLRKKKKRGERGGFRATAEMGAQIITGFDNGNPLNALVRGQLALPYHAIRDNSILFDYDGAHVDKARDVLVEKLYNDILEKVSSYRHRSEQEAIVEGEKRQIELSKDPYNEEGPLVDTSHTISSIITNGFKPNTEDFNTTGMSKVRTSTDLNGDSMQISNGVGIIHSDLARSVTEQQKMGVESRILSNLDNIAKKSRITLGEVMDEAIRQYEEASNLSTQDLRLLNWHNANLEYANAANINQLSLEGWDQDIGNEFEGEHTEIVGGYLQVPRGLWKYPSKLNIRFKHRVERVICRKGCEGGQRPISIECAGESAIEADQIIITTPLGVLKEGAIEFEPPLPAWKNDCIERIGFGLLNKIILVYEDMFWEKDRDMFGHLNQSSIDESLRPEDYASQRGRFYLFWNCAKTSGVPVLTVLMAGDSAVDVETSETNVIVEELTIKLQQMYPSVKVPWPSEVVITKWRKDPMARGSYSYVAPETLPGDYGLMSQPVGPIHFAGEATCGTHPATVHGAYLSGLRAASEVLDDMIGTMEIADPLVKPKLYDKTYHFSPNNTLKVKEEQRSRYSEQEAYEIDIVSRIHEKLGERPTKPARIAANPFLLFQKDYWSVCKAQCDEERQNATKNPEAKASRNTIRAALGHKWRNATAEIKEPYLERAKGLKENTATDMNAFRKRLLEWDRNAERIRHTYIKQNPFKREKTRSTCG